MKIEIELDDEILKSLANTAANEALRVGDGYAKQSGAAYRAISEKVNAALLAFDIEPMVERIAAQLAPGVVENLVMRRLEKDVVKSIKALKVKRPDLFTAGGSE